MGREDDPTQTTPQGETIPFPTREQVLRDLRKVAKAPEPSERSGDDEGGAPEK